MVSIYNRFKELREKGQGIVEYALILAFVAVVAAGLTNAGGLKDKVSSSFTAIAGAFATN